jgi:hypothetical protein
MAKTGLAGLRLTGRDQAAARAVAPARIRIGSWPPISLSQRDACCRRQRGYDRCELVSLLDVTEHGL